MHLQGMGCPALIHVLFDGGFGVLMHLQGTGCPALIHVLFVCGFLGGVGGGGAGRGWG